MLIGEHLINSTKYQTEFSILQKVRSWHLVTTSWDIEGEKVEAVTDFLLWGSKFTAVGDNSYKIRRQLLPGRKATTNLESC